MVAGRYESFPLPGGGSADLFLVRFGADGRLRSPQAAAAFLAAAREATDVFCFSHGWNNVFDIALGRYREFIRKFIQQRTTLDLPTPDGYRPVLLGIVWPSTSFVLPWEAGPQIAAAPDERLASEQEEMLSLLTSALPVEKDARLTELVDGRTDLDQDEAREAAALVLQALGDENPETGWPAPTVEDLIESWRNLDGADAPVRADDDDAFGTISGPALGGAGEPEFAGKVSLDPRNLLRGGTVWLMKGRAGQVGVNGLGPLLDVLLSGEDGPRVHLIGHSYGARVVLSALASISPDHKAHSMLLLQAAVNRWCFAPQIPGGGGAGGYRPVLDRLELPVIATFSSHDAPLHRYFHLAMRAGHIGEQEIGGFSRPELYGALGGYGPAGLGTEAFTQPALAPGDRSYPFVGKHRVVALDGEHRVGNAPAIRGHSDVINPVTLWALHCLAAPA